MKIEISTQDICNFYKTLRLHPQPGFVNLKDIGQVNSFYKKDEEKIQIPYTKITLRKEYVKKFENWAKNNKAEYTKI